MYDEINNSISRTVWTNMADKLRWYGWYWWIRVEAHDLKSIRLGYMELGNYSNPHHCTQQEILLFQVVENRKIFRKWIFWVKKEREVTLKHSGGLALVPHSSRCSTTHTSDKVCVLLQAQTNLRTLKKRESSFFSVCSMGLCDVDEAWRYYKWTLFQTNCQ